MASCEGFVLKETKSMLKDSWKKKYVVVGGGEVHYGKGPSDAGSSSVKLFDDTTIVDVTNHNGQVFVVEVRTKGQRSSFFALETAEEKDKWMAALKGTVKARASRRLGLDDFKLLKVIGQGSFGKVMQVVKKDNGKVYAMKVLNKKTIVERNDEEHIKSERRILERLDHPFLVNLHYSFQTPDKLYFIMDYVNGGELFFHMQQVDCFDEERSRFYVAEIGCGLEYLHKEGVLYRDLKPENVLVSRKGHICLTDFGISKQGFEGGENKTQTFVGTPEYLAPEILQGKPYGLAVDYWSLGTLFYEMCTGLPPFYAEDVQKMYQKILKSPISKPDGISDDAWDLLQALLERDPEKRLTDPAAFKAHPFFKSLDFDKLVALKLDPPYKPPVKDDLSTAMIDSQFTDEKITESEFLSGETVKNFEGFTFGGAANKEKKGVA